MDRTDTRHIMLGNFIQHCMQPMEGDMDPASTASAIITDRLSAQGNNSQPAIMQKNGRTLDKNAITACLMASTGPHVDTEAMRILDETYAGTLKGYQLGYDPDMAALNQYAASEGLPMPDRNIVYLASTDAQPASEAFLAGKATEKFYAASMGFFMKSKTMAVYMKDRETFGRLKAYIGMRTAELSDALPYVTMTALNKFRDIDLGLVEVILIRSQLSPAMEPYSFARCIVRLTMEFLQASSPPDAGLIPVSISQMILPTAISFINVSRHAKENAKTIKNEWQKIQDRLTGPPIVLKPGQVNSLTESIRRQNVIDRQIRDLMAKNSNPCRNRMKPFNSRCPETAEISRAIQKLIRNAAFVQKSHNTSLARKATCLRQSRRRPEDPNALGTATSIRYKPDIHLYVDTSGSISESQFKNAVMASIMAAKKLNINIYVNCFSTVLTQAVLLHTKGHSVRQAYRQFLSAATISGGTDFSAVWKYINASARRRSEISVILTDFDYTAPSQYVRHPENLYYLPCASLEWDWICRFAQKFCESAKHIDSAMRERLLF